MKNPFDQIFFKFLFGFSVIISVSFMIMFAVVKYDSTNQAHQGAVVEVDK